MLVLRSRVSRLSRRRLLRPMTTSCCCGTTSPPPNGNGSLGAMIFGGPASEQLQLNEDTLYAGLPYDPNNPEALHALPEARRLIFEGRYKEAHDLIGAKMMANPIKQMPYEPVGD